MAQIAPVTAMSEKLHIGIIGAGIVGLSSALWLQRAGFRVTLIDRSEPGQGASFGNAGLFADYARLPFARFSTLCRMPGLLLDRQSPLSMSPRYLPTLTPYGWHFFRACLPARYRRGRQALTELQQHASAADQQLLKATGAEDLVRNGGCLGLFSTPEGFARARVGDLRERQLQGVELYLLEAAEVRDLEPGLTDFCAGGVLYPNTRFTVSPLELCRRFAHHFAGNGGELLTEAVSFVTPRADSIEVQTSGRRQRFDRLVIAAGTASRWLCEQLGCHIPLVSERGYHLSLDSNGRSLNRPVGWLDKSVFLTPMRGGIRVAGTAEFADTDAPPSSDRTRVMLEHARTMLGEDAEVRASWVGSRPSTPDSLPVIGALCEHPRISLAFGHGHLGLTLAAITGQLVAQQIAGEPTVVPLEYFSPDRF